MISLSLSFSSSPLPLPYLLSPRLFYPLPFSSSFALPSWYFCTVAAAATSSSSSSIIGRNCSNGDSSNSYGSVATSYLRDFYLPIIPVIRSHRRGADIMTADKRKRFEITTGDGASGCTPHQARERAEFPLASSRCCIVYTNSYME